MSEKEQNYTIAEEFELPSKGLIYDKQINPIVKLRSMTARDEMKRLAPSNTPYKVLAELIDNCTVNEIGMSVYDMCLADYEFLLHKLRVVTYGPEYNTSSVCPFCNNMVESKISLDDLFVNEYEDGQNDDLQTFTLPVSNKKIRLKYQTPRILDETELKIKEFKKRYKDLNLDPTLLIFLEMSIDTVDGVKLNSVELENFINKLSAKDSNVIRNKIEKLNQSFGIDNKILISCPECHEDIISFFRFGPEFFRPTID